MSFDRKKADLIDSNDVEVDEGQRQLRIIDIKEHEPIFNVADTLVLLHVAEIWNYKPRQLFGCRVPDYVHGPTNSLLRNAEKGWCGAGLYAVAPIWDWITSFRPHLNIPKENMYGKVLGDGRSADSSKVH